MMTSPFAAGRVNMDTVRTFTTTLFAGWDWAREGGCIALRGIGEKGTDKDGKFREPKFIDPRTPFAWSQIETHLTRWGDNGVAAFILPAIAADAAAKDGHATDDRIQAFTALALDIDSGNVADKLEHCRDWIGEPTMIVHSGGVTDLGHAKVHAYWCLTTPTTRVKDVGRIRKILAAKVGGDQSFGRPAQVIRVAGSIYGKGGTCKPVELIKHGGPRHDFADLVEAIEGMEWMEGCMPVLDLPSMAPGGAMDFSAGASIHQRALERILTEPVHEGGEGGVTRWDNFNAVAGHHIHCIRTGAETMEEAREAAWGWALANMVPPWPRARFDSEWAGLLAKDVREKGEVVAPPPVPPEIKPFQNNTTKAEMIDSADALRQWGVHRWTNYDPQPRRLLVPGFIHAGKRHMFASEGGAGKSNLLMDLAIKLVMADDNNPQFWMGQKITPHAHGGTVIILTGEDGKEELDHRWKALDPTGEGRRRAGDRLIAIPFESAGGAYPFVEYDPKTGRDQRTPQWAGLLKAMAEMQEQGDNIILVIVDTLNTTFHGEENSAEKVGEYVRAVQPVTGELDAALLIAHHAKKTDSDKPIKSLDDMRAAVRGSSALINAMRVVIGLWPDHKYAQTMKAMGMQPKREKLYMAGVVKANVPCADEARHLLRDVNGVLQDVTGMVQQAVQRSSNDEAKTWIAFAIEQYAEQQMYFTKTATNALHEHTHLLHPSLHTWSRNEIWKAVDEMLKEKKLIKRTVAGMGNRAGFLDTFDNKNTPREAPTGDLGTTPIDYDQWVINPRTGKVEMAENGHSGVTG